MTTLLFLPADPAAPLEWLRLDDSGGVARGTGAPAASDAHGAREAAAGAATGVVAVAPPAAVTLRWIDLPASLSGAQALAAARLAAAGLAAEPADLLHIALADAPDADGRRLIAIARADAVAAWLDRLAGAGLAAERLLPAPMLLPLAADAPATGLLRDGLLWVRGPGRAFAAEPDVAAAMLDEPPRLLDPAEFEAALPATLSSAQPDLLQGRFALRAPFAPDWPRLRRAAALLVAIALAVAAADVARGWRASLAAEAARTQAAALARPLLPAGARVTDPAAQLAALGTGEARADFSEMAAALFAAARDSEGTTLDSLEHSADGRLRAALAAPSVAGLAGVESRLDGLGFEATLGPVRADGGRQRAELTLRGRS